MNSIAQTPKQNNPQNPVVPFNYSDWLEQYHRDLAAFVLAPADHLLQHNGFTPGNLESVALQFYSETEALSRDLATTLTRWEAEDQEMRMK